MPAPLAPLFPAGGLQRGIVVAVTGTGAAAAFAPWRDGGPEGTTLALGLLAGMSAAGSWCAVVGLAEPGILAMAELGLVLERSPLVPRPGPRWPEVTAVLLAGTDAVLLRPPGPVRPGTARRLAALARQQRSVLVLLAGRGDWPEGPDLHVAVRPVPGGPPGGWHGIGAGYGYLRGRHVEVTATGRRAATRPLVTRLWLPDAAGGLARG